MAHVLVLAFFVLIFGVFLGCRHPSTGPASVAPHRDLTPPATASIGQPFELRLGESVQVDSDDLTVLFDQVVADSRCPVGIDCVWEGDAVVQLRLDKAKNGTSFVQLHTSTSSPTDASYREYRVRLEKLTPRPRAEAKIEPREYVSTLIVEKPR
jgi:hypothetical protein